MIINLATPAQREKFLAEVNGGAREEKPKPWDDLGRKPLEQVVPELLRFMRDGYELQLPFCVECQHGYAKAHWAVKADVVKAQSIRVIHRMATFLSRINWSQLQHITFTRFSPRQMDDDNLETSFKNIRDATSFSVLNPGEVLLEKDPRWHTIGNWDGKLKQLLEQRQPGRKPWTYEQRKNDSERTSGKRTKPRGIAIRFHIGAA